MKHVGADWAPEMATQSKHAVVIDTLSLCESRHVRENGGLVCIQRP